jgi:hypothetical protein
MLTKQELEEREEKSRIDEKINEVNRIFDLYNKLIAKIDSDIKSLNDTMKDMIILAKMASEFDENTGVLISARLRLKFIMSTVVNIYTRLLNIVSGMKLKSRFKEDVINDVTEASNKVFE